MRNVFLLTLLVICVRSSYCDKKSDDYVLTVQAECYSSKRLFSCFKYRFARYIWSFASGRMNLFETEATSSVDVDGTGGIVKLVQLSEPELDDNIFQDQRQMPNDNEIGKALKFAKRALTTFIAGHGVRIGINSEGGPRVLETNFVDEVGESRGKNKRKKKKLSMILPLAILLKVAHLKLTLLPILLGVGLIQLILIAGGALLFAYLRNNTHCRIQPHLVHSHSHVSETGPEVSYSSYGAGFGAGAGAGGPSFVAGGHGGGFNKDWATNRAYSAYNFIDKQ